MRSTPTIDQLLTIAGPDALRCSRDWRTKEGIFVGITAGATFAGALKVAPSAPTGANILCMLPDTGERYLSHPAVRRRAGGHDRRGTGDLALDPARRTTGG